MHGARKIAEAAYFVTDDRSQLFDCGPHGACYGDYWGSAEVGFLLVHLSSWSFQPVAGSCTIEDYSSTVRYSGCTN